LVFLNQPKENCPYDLAVELGVIVTRYPYIVDDIVCSYTLSGRSTYRVYINPDPSLDENEVIKALFILLEHHQMAIGVAREVTKSDLKIINKFVAKARKLDEMVSNIFLRGTIFNK
jgi:hypothetical protein